MCERERERKRKRGRFFLSVEGKFLSINYSISCVLLVLWGFRENKKLENTNPVSDSRVIGASDAAAGNLCGSVRIYLLGPGLHAHLGIGLLSNFASLGQRYQLFFIDMLR